MHRILSTVAVAYEPIGSDFVIIRARLTFNYRHGRNAEGNLGQDGGFENSLRSEKSDPCCLEFETRCQDFALPEKAQLTKRYQYRPIPKLNPGP